jgi:hypothetical protein
MPIQFVQGIETWSFTLCQGGPTGTLGNVVHSNTVNRTYTLPDKDGTVALLSDLNQNSSQEGLQLLSKVILSQGMGALTCFRINEQGQAFTVTANDDILPIVNGITLESGGIGSTINAAQLRNESYTTTAFFQFHQLFWLTSSGQISSTRPTNTKYQVMVGYSIPNSSLFVFDPQMPIKLA